MARSFTLGRQLTRKIRRRQKRLDENAGIYPRTVDKNLPSVTFIGSKEKVRKDIEIVRNWLKIFGHRISSRVLKSIQSSLERIETYIIYEKKGPGYRVATSSKKYSIFSAELHLKNSSRKLGYKKFEIAYRDIDARSKKVFLLSNFLICP